MHGKLTGEANDRGENTTENIAGRLGKGSSTAPIAQWARRPGGVMGANDGSISHGCEGPLHLTCRPPVLCGLPHRGSFYAVKQAPAAARRCCRGHRLYTPAMPSRSMPWTPALHGRGHYYGPGLSRWPSRKKQVAFVGDSNFFASAMTGIANAVYNGHDVTFAILDNATTAMTAASPPGTGVTLMGERRRPIVIEEVLHGLGIQHIRFANPHSLESSVAAARGHRLRRPVGDHLPRPVHPAEEARCAGDDRRRYVHRLQEVHHLHRVPWHRLRRRAARPEIRRTRASVRGHEPV